MSNKPATVTKRRKLDSETTLSTQALEYLGDVGQIMKERNWKKEERLEGL